MWYIGELVCHNEKSNRVVRYERNGRFKLEKELNLNTGEGVEKFQTINKWKQVKTSKQIYSIVRLLTKG